MAKFSTQPKEMPKAPAKPGDKPTGKLPERGERTAKNYSKRGDGEASHPQSHADFERLGSD